MNKKGIWIPIELMNDKKLDWSNKVLLSEIYSLVKLENGCIASNNHFADLLGINKSAASKRISQLENLGYVTCTNKYKDRLCIGRVITKGGFPKNNTVVPKEHRGSSHNTRGVVPTEPDPSSLGKPINTSTNSGLKVQLHIHNTGASNLGENSNSKTYKSQHEATKESHDDAATFLLVATSIGDEIFDYTEPSKFSDLIGRIGKEEFNRIEWQLRRYVETGKQLGHG